jgi:hypothetical protein
MYVCGIGPPTDRKISLSPASIKGDVSHVSIYGLSGPR